MPDREKKRLATLRALLKGLPADETAAFMDEVEVDLNPKVGCMWMRRGQQAAVPVIGFLSARAERESAHLVDAFRRGLAEQGLNEGQNLAIEFRWADGHYDRLPGQALQFSRMPVTVLVAVGGDMTARAAVAVARSA